MTEREQLEQAITALEAQRAILGDATVDTAIATLREALSAGELEAALERGKSLDMGEVVAKVLKEATGGIY